MTAFDQIWSLLRDLGAKSLSCVDVRQRDGSVRVIAGRCLERDDDVLEFHVADEEVVRIEKMASPWPWPAWPRALAAIAGTTSAGDLRRWVGERLLGWFVVVVDILPVSSPLVVEGGEPYCRVVLKRDAEHFVIRTTPTGTTFEVQR